MSAITLISFETTKMEKGEFMLKGKKVIVFGERDDIPATTVSTCLKAAGAEVVYENNACFV